MMGVTPTGPGCEPTASAADASSQSRIPNAADQLTHALSMMIPQYDGPDGLKVTVDCVEERPWASVTFTGAHWRLLMTLDGPNAGSWADWFLPGLEERDIPLRGHILVNIAKIADEREGGTVRLILEALTVSEGARDTDRSGEADETAKQAQPKARAGAEGIAQTTEPPVRNEP